MTEPDYELFARFLKECEQAGDRRDVLTRWARDFPRLAAELEALAGADRLLGRVRPGPDPVPPERLGDFRIIRQVASGGMGVVYEAVQEPFQRRVAVKTIRQPLLSEQARARFLREQAVLARLHQTHIVPIYAAGCAGDTHYFAMPFIDGVSLQEVVGRLRRLPPGSTAPTPAELAARLRESAADGEKQREVPGQVRRTREYIRAAAACVADVAEAIAFAHAQGIMHRDLKPANLMIDAAGHVWVLDFGLAGFLARDCENGESVGSALSSEVSAPGVTAGTLDYMAPEQLEGVADERTDVWGIGAVLYELLTLRRAFALSSDAGAPLERRRREWENGLTPPRSLAPGLSRDLDAICRKCLQCDPAARYPTARAVADDLRRYLRGEETHARPYSPAERLAHWARRHPDRAGWTAVSAVLLLFLTLVVGHVAEVRAANARYARKLARSVELQFQLLQNAVRETASPEGKEDEDDLPALLREFHGDPAPIQQSLRRTKRSFESDINWFRRPGEDPAFVNWFVMDRTGNILTDSSPSPVQGNYRERDYARPLGGADDGAYLSRVFRSEQDGKYKFAAVVRIEERGELRGLLAATMAIDSRLVALDLRDEEVGATVVGPMDWARNAPADGNRPSHVVVLHVDYDGSGEQPLWVEGDLATPLRLFEQDPSRGAAVLSLTDAGEFVDYARVGGSHFVVMVRRPYPWLLSWIFPRPVLMVLAGLGGIVTCFAVGWRIVRRRQMLPVS